MKRVLDKEARVRQQAEAKLKKERRAHLEAQKKVG